MNIGEAGQPSTERSLRQWGLGQSALHSVLSSSFYSELIEKLFGRHIFHDFFSRLEDRFFYRLIFENSHCFPDFS